MIDLRLRIVALMVIALVTVIGGLLAASVGEPVGAAVAIVGILLSTGVAIWFEIRGQRAEDDLRRKAADAQLAADEALRQATRPETMLEQHHRLRRDQSANQTRYGDQ